MVKNFYYRFLVIVTTLVGILFIGSVPEMMKTSTWIIWAFTFFTLCYFVYINFKNLSEDRINEILWLNFFKKIGCDFSEE